MADRPARGFKEGESEQHFQIVRALLGDEKFSANLPLITILHLFKFIPLGEQNELHIECRNCGLGTTSLPLEEVLHDDTKVNEHCWEHFKQCPNLPECARHKEDSDGESADA